MCQLFICIVSKRFNPMLIIPNDHALKNGLSYNKISDLVYNHPDNSSFSDKGNLVWKICLYIGFKDEFIQKNCQDYLNYMSC